MRLTKREAEVVVKVVNGLKRKAIGMELGIAEKTVDFHLLRIRRKIGKSSMLEIAVFFSRETFTAHTSE